MLSMYNRMENTPDLIASLAVAQSAETEGRTGGVITEGHWKATGLCCVSPLLGPNGRHDTNVNEDYLSAYINRRFTNLHS